MAGSYLDVGFGEDVLVDILSRLPVKSLLRFKCACKFWYALINSTVFITKHLQRNVTTLIEGNAPLFGIGFEEYFENVETKSGSVSKKKTKKKKKNKTKSPTYKPTVLWIDTETTTPLLDDDDQKVPSIDPNCLPFSDGGNAIPCTILGPVNGIYCAIRHIKDGIMYLCNPALREVQAIPKVPIPDLVPLMTQDDPLPYEPEVINKFGFGYDSRVNDYKVVTITSVTDFVQPPRIYVFLYTLRSNSWREIECDRDIFIDRPVIEPSFMSHGNAVAHWLVQDLHAECHHVIISFDFVNEVFRKSNLPGFYVINDKPDVIRECDVARGYYIAILNDESIVLIVSLSPPQGYNYNDIEITGSCWEAWVMKKYGVNESWTKLFSTEHLPQLCWLFGFHKNSGEALFMTWERQLVSYDPISQRIKDLHNSDFKIIQVCTYMESLVSISKVG